MTRFHKMHGLGNDFVIVDRRDQPVDVGTFLRLGDRRTGIGYDQLIILDTAKGADLSMSISNQDGSHAGMCGNAARCVAWWEARRTGKSSVSIKIGDRIVNTDTVTDYAMTVDMGAPKLDWQEIPLERACDTLDVPGLPAELGQASAVSMGNPHIVFFVPDLDAIDVSRWGPLLEKHPMFPEKTNVEFVQVLNRHTLKVIVWERGTGLTQACGSGACAVGVAAIRRGLAQSPLVTYFPGGELGIEWKEGSGVKMTGPVVHVYEGVITPAG